MQEHEVRLWRSGTRRRPSKHLIRGSLRGRTSLRPSAGYWNTAGERFVVFSVFPHMGLLSTPGTFLSRRGSDDEVVFCEGTRLLCMNPGGHSVLRRSTRWTLPKATRGFTRYFCGMGSCSLRIRGGIRFCGFRRIQVRLLKRSRCFSIRSDLLSSMIIIT